jgi:hypothetical protein
VKNWALKLPSFTRRGWFIELTFKTTPLSPPIERGDFQPLSEELAGAAEHFGVEGVVYVQHCPMAFNNQGGSWLSREEQIANPYLPATMLRCGRVIGRVES